MNTLADKRALAVLKGDRVAGSVCPGGSITRGEGG